MNTTRDTVRQGVVVVSAVIAVVGSFIGSGAAGGIPIDEAAGGALGAAATPIAPAGPAFAIWSVIYSGLIGYAAWQALPKQRADARQRSIGYWVAASLVLNAAWILSIQFDLLPWSVPIIAALLVVLVQCFRLCLATPAGSPVEKIVLDGTIGLYLGWVCVATAANVTAFLVAAGFRGFGIAADVWAVVVIAVAGAVGVLLAVYGSGRVTPAIALCWGLAWLAVGRITGELVSVPAAIAAIVAVTVVVVATAIALAVARKSAPRQKAATA